MSDKERSDLTTPITMTKEEADRVLDADERIYKLIKELQSELSQVKEKLDKSLRREEIMRDALVLADKLYADDARRSDIIAEALKKCESIG